MPTLPPDRPNPPTVSGPGGAQPPSGQSERDRILPAAAAAGGVGLLIGLLFAAGLTPFGPDGSQAQPDGSRPVPVVSPTASAVASKPPAAAKPTAKATAKAKPTPPAGFPGTLRSVGTSLCLEVADQAAVDGAPVRQVACTGGRRQGWRLDSAGGIITVVNTATGGCLDITGASTDNDVPVQQWTCQPVPQQQWRATPAGNGFALVSLISNRCLDVPGGSRDQGVQMRQHDCNGTVAQQWLFGG